MDNIQVTELKMNISAVERDTGLSKDTLRMWERRYGFPEPGRDANGERAYPVSQVEKLRLIRRLMDRGHRPGKIIGLDLEHLAALGSLPDSASRAHDDLDIYIRLIKTHQLADLRRHLAQAHMKQGLQRFILDTVAPLTTVVGDAWMRGEFAVFEEHLYTEQVQSMLRNAIAGVQPQGQAPRVLLTSFPNEPHSLGLLMVEALLAVEGAACIPLGTETPLADIVRAADAHRADVIALSFSAAYGEKHAAAGLAELRALLPQAVEVWAGGASIARLRRDVPGTTLIRSLDELIGQIEVWRDAHRTGPRSYTAPRA
jgi:DNA-binding transcriptional MerR regulator/methylmalonyl-CoA mutase cobalamin-binding subunit